MIIIIKNGNHELIALNESNIGKTLEDAEIPEINRRQFILKSASIFQFLSLIKANNFKEISYKNNAIPSISTYRQKNND